MSVDVSALLRRGFGPAYAKGLRYFEAGRVRLLEWDAESATGDVQGSRPRPYRVRLRLDRRQSSMGLDGECTCPVGFECKHLVALTLAWQAQLRKAQPDAIAPEGEPDPWPRWLEEQARETSATTPREMLVYCARVEAGTLFVRPALSKLGKQGWSTGRALNLHAPKSNNFIFEREIEDRVLLRCLQESSSIAFDEEVEPWFETPGALVESLLATGRTHWLHALGTELRAARERELTLAWAAGDDGTQSLVARAGEHGIAFGESLGWYVDPRSGAVGRTRSELPPEQRRRMLELPPVHPEHVDAATRAFADAGLATALPPLRRFSVRTTTNVVPRARLLLTRPHGDHLPDRLKRGVEAELSFRYGDVVLQAHDGRRTFRRRDSHDIALTLRDDAFEASIARFLEIEGFAPGTRTAGMAAFHWHRPRAMSGPQIGEWLREFSERASRVLLDVETHEYFPVRGGPDWGAPELSVEESENGWFEAHVGITVDGEPVDLLPVLLRALDDASARTSHGLALTLPGGRRVVLPNDRVDGLLGVLADFERREDRFGVPRAKLAAIVPPPDWRFLPGERTRAFLDELEHFEGMEAVTPPDDFQATLRPYQATGLAWLEFLRRYGFGGVLADDMGLGKTVQVLAFIARERSLGRLTHPVLVVCPTSVAPNWQAEAQRFAPTLRVGLLARGDRAPLLATLPQYDIIITSYALMLRDIETLAAQPWSLLVLDESQWLKNRTSQGFKAALKLRATQVLCLTGTPVENHLDELKAQLDLAMPGLLGDERSFKERFRVPIERERDAEASARLRQRMRPFLLRRRKAEVASELPPRTTIDVPVALGEAQRDLYEAIRARMETRVREALSERGLARSHVTVLDALLKLRQVCCDPQLVDLAQAKRVTASAKRETLNDLLPTMVEDGRSVLLFSQFTTMLDLIQADLRERELPFERLDGNTRDRRTPVRRFQAGEVPILLLSLKAGGVGLNLTRADTVIMYDPWWNPAAEAQAIDRAHRIGQDKPVFVYQLVCKDTVEERMQALKDRKRAVADAVLGGEERAIEQLGAADLVALFASE